MPEFLIFAVAVSMCVLCFAVGFIAALVLRFTQQMAASPAAAPEPVQTSIPPEPAAVQTTSAAAAPAPAPVVPSISLPQVERTEQQHDAPAVRPAPPLPQRPAAHAVPSAGFPAPQPAPPAKVYLFGDPPAEPAAVPAMTPMYAAAAPNTRPVKQHVSPRLAPAEVDLLPRRPQHARSGRR
jgi:hypothetical protein